MLVVAMATVVTVYVLIQIVCIGTLPNLAISRRPLADAADRFLGEPGVLLMMLGIVISLIGNLNTNLLSASRVIFAMAERRDLPPQLAFIDERRRTPVYAVAGTVAVILGLALSGTFIYLLTLSSLAKLVTYIATCASLLVFQKRSGMPTAAFVLSGGTMLACVGIVICVWLLAATSLRAGRDTIIAVLLGLALYAATRYFFAARDSEIVKTEAG